MTLDTKKISVIKTLTYRILAMITTTSVVWMATGTLKFALGVGLIDAMFKMVVYYSHERVWERIKKKTMAID